MAERQQARDAEKQKRELTITMKTPIKLAMIGALGVLTSTASLAQPNPGDDASPPNPTRNRPGFDGPGPAAPRQVLLEKYDANKDGKLDDKEFSNLGKDVFEGKLPPPGRGPGPGFPGERSGRGFGPQRRGGPDGPEFGASERPGPRGDRDRIPSPREDRMSDGPGPRSGRMMDRGSIGEDGGPDRPPMARGPRGFGRPDSEEGKQMAARHRQEFIKKYDANGDGKLDAPEREAIGKDIEDGKLLPPPLPPAGREDARPKEQ